MENFKYSLAKQGKYICPSCGQKRFVLYIDNETGTPVHPTVGRCDREVNCGYHYPPKQYFKDNNIPFDTDLISMLTSKAISKPQSQPSYLKADMLRYSLRGLEYDNFVQFLCRIAGKEAADKAVGMYHIGTSKYGTIFWQIDRLGKIHAGKIIQYDTDGHRRKDVSPPVRWVHTALKLPDFVLSQCFFGEHLLRDTKTVAIVESEKTAIIASLYLPDFICIACGGSEGLNPVKYECLKGRKVLLYPDAGMYDKWCKKAEQLQAICTSVVVSDLIEKEAAEAERKAGYDIADYLVKSALLDVPMQMEGYSRPERSSTEVYLPDKDYYLKLIREGRQRILKARSERSSAEMYSSNIASLEIKQLEWYNRLEMSLTKIDLSNKVYSGIMRDRKQLEWYARLEQSLTEVDLPDRDYYLRDIREGRQRILEARSERYRSGYIKKGKPDTI
ncbi:MAG: DUF6371 domain-containing protein [Prevotellaceae bacterium]|jgi:hypothetical protein|nr:DUF6371 domain-containing protein [Prevotellaceae bacterium]